MLPQAKVNLWTSDGPTEFQNGKATFCHYPKTTRITTFQDLSAFAGFCGRLREICGRFAGNSCREKMEKLGKSGIFPKL